MVNPIVPIMEATVTRPEPPATVQLFFYEAKCDICGKTTLTLYAEAQNPDDGNPHPSVHLCQPCIEGLFGLAQQRLDAS